MSEYIEGSARWKIIVVRAVLMVVSTFAALIGYFAWWWLSVSVIGLGFLVRDVVTDDAFGEDGSYVIFDLLWSFLFVVLGPFGAWICADRVVRFIAGSK